MDNNTKILTKQYLELQAANDRLQKQINELRERRKQVEAQLVRNIQAHGLQKHAITYQGHKVYLGRETCYDGLTYRFLENCLMKLFNDKNKVAQIIKFIKSCRGKTQNYCIKTG